MDNKAMAVKPWISCSRLLRAIEGNDIQTAEKLFDGGIDVDSIIFSETLTMPTTAILLCVKMGHFEMAKMVIRKGCSFCVTTVAGDNPLHLAAMTSNVELVQLLLDNGADVRIPNKQNQTALHKACTGSSMEIVRLLVTKGCSVNNPDINGKTPLILACSEKRVHFVRYLLQMGSEVNVVDLRGSSPILYAIEGIQCSQEEMALVLKNVAKEQLKEIHCRGPSEIQDPHSLEDRIAIVKLLIDAGSDVNATNAVGQSCLHYAIFEDAEDLVRKLLNAGCNVDVADSIGNFPLFYACRDGRIALAKLLVEAGADLHKQKWLHFETYNVWHDHLPFYQYKIYDVRPDCHTCLNRREALDYLKQKLHEFPRLDDMCRTAIRKHLGRKLEMVLPELQLSDILLKYIRLQ